MTLTKRSKGQGGFTLIELVAVVIILGILAAVIVPKYFDMTSKAQDAAYKGAITEGVARLNMAYSKYILDTSVKPTDVTTTLGGASYLNLTGGKVSIGDYQIGYSDPAGTPKTVTITLYNAAGTTVLKNSTNSDVTTAYPWPD
jgi:prepilin-type N-terminal cleavage/methylation domain-containing protein